MSMAPPQVYASIVLFRGQSEFRAPRPSTPQRPIPYN